MCMSTETDGIVDTEKAAGCKLHSPQLSLSKDKLISDNPSVFPYPHPYPHKGVGYKTHKRLGFKSLYKRVADAHLVPF